MNRRRSELLALIFSCLLGCGPAWGAQEGQITLLDGVPRIGGLEMLSAGEKAPRFSLEDIDGKPFVLASKAGKTYLAVFWSIFCASCRAQDVSAVH